MTYWDALADVPGILQNQMGGKYQGKRRTSVGENDVCDGEEGHLEVCRHRHSDLPITRLLIAHSCHGDDNCSDDRDEARNSQIADFVQGPWHGADQRDDQTDDPKDDRAGPVACDSIHHDREGQNMAAHDKDEEEDLCATEDLSADGAEHHFSCVGHVVDVWEGELELSDHVTGVRREYAQACDEDDTTARAHCVSVQLYVGDGMGRGMGQSYGTSPIVARTDGSDRMPKDIVSAIMTIPACHHSIVLYLTSECVSSPNGSPLLPSKPSALKGVPFSASSLLCLLS